ncbi:MAG: polyphosphate polymerase domain-containing protein [Candidatus Ruminococcus intestinipullorum]|nr:polyphosphate polymerase domain-containing protein [Candidatus Ruminococcus intestinipullorum]
MNEVYRKEHKYLISTTTFFECKAALSHILQEDSHTKKYGFYEVRSLYFDSIDDRDYVEKLDGVEIRRKIRLRNYGADSTFALLEMKQKQGDYQKKRSLRLEKSDALELISGNYTVLLKYNTPFALECYSIMNMYCYRPATVVSYKRRAFLAKENKIRITFDYDICATESSFNIFSDLNQFPVLDPYASVLEVKYNGFLPSYIKDVINSHIHTQVSVSKYCLARKISKHYVFI